MNGDAKGKDYERRLAGWFEELGYAGARRMVRTGTRRHADEGDIAGLPFTVQAKTWASDPTDAVIDKWHAEAIGQAKAAGHLLALLVVKRNGHGDVGKSWVYLDALSLARLVNPGFTLTRSFGLNWTAWNMRVRVSLRKLAELLVIVYPPS